jgi:hypothetical protein
LSKLRISPFPHPWHIYRRIFKLLKYLGQVLWVLNVLITHRLWNDIPFGECLLAVVFKLCLSSPQGFLVVPQTVVEMLNWFVLRIILTVRVGVVLLNKRLTFTSTEVLEFAVIPWDMLSLHLLIGRYFLWLLEVL